MAEFSRIIKTISSLSSLMFLLTQCAPSNATIVPPITPRPPVVEPAQVFPTPTRVTYVQTPTAHPTSTPTFEPTATLISPDALPSLLASTPLPQPTEEFDKPIRVNKNFSVRIATTIDSETENSIVQDLQSIAPNLDSTMAEINSLLPPAQEISTVKVYLHGTEDAAAAGSTTVENSTGCFSGTPRIDLNANNFNSVRLDEQMLKGEPVSSFEHTIVHEVGHVVMVKILGNHIVSSFSEAGAEGHAFSVLGPQALPYLDAFRKNPQSVPPKERANLSFWDYRARTLFTAYARGTHYLPVANNDYSFFDFYSDLAKKYGLTPLQLLASSSQHMATLACNNIAYQYEEDTFGKDIVQAVQDSDPTFKGSIYDLEAMYVASLLPDSQNASQGKELFAPYIVKAIDIIPSGAQTIDMAGLSSRFRIIQARSNVTITFDSSLLSVTSINGFGQVVSVLSGERPQTSADNTYYVVVLKQDSEKAQINISQ